MDDWDLYRPFQPWWQEGNRGKRRSMRAIWGHSQKERDAKAARNRAARKAKQARKRRNKGGQG